jgi:hypothetical protein
MRWWSIQGPVCFSPDGKIHASGPDDEKVVV